MSKKEEPTFRILVVEDEPVPARVIWERLQREGYGVVPCASAEEAWSHLESNRVDLILLDSRLPGMSGEELFRKVRTVNPTIPVIFMTAYSSVERAVAMLREGAFQYLTKPLELCALVHLGRQAEEKGIRIRENSRLSELVSRRYESTGLVFASEKMQEVVNLVLRTARSQATVLISGESGTGKEVVAGMVHLHSQRSRGPFQKVNLAALPATLVEAELFGAVKGAFTGATENRKGRFEEADGGTIFLDEIGELSLEVQVKLLRVIQEREVTRLGSNRPIPVNIRIIAATNRDLREMVAERTFREDLFFRLNVVTVELPPLRERREEIPLLVERFLRAFAEREQKIVTGLTREAMDLLVRYPYPGNIRELENIVERAVVLTRSDVIAPRDLPEPVQRVEQEADPRVWMESGLPLAERLERLERMMILESLRRNRFHQTRAARALGISESGLRYKMQHLGIEKPEDPR